MNQRSLLITVKVNPGCSKTEIREKLEDGTLKINIAAPADRGKANIELIKFLAREFSVSKNDVEIVSGKTSRDKLVKISGQGVG
ncbi:YggU family protein [Candidatus Peribacteria bacterium]|jgi:uncharacterized protein|nr:YggU family protein [Candidatus Peribacteria bacterium]MBT4021257.1 YggU family protein [Candidatus Peribacteria bacterium]MBT4240678.1 YggU family protein [Candidatus Peribacteria bacterium]MBT4474023.1 YggU family protein [Candidatus Peribacteria bacterium]